MADRSPFTQLEELLGSDIPLLDAVLTESFQDTEELIPIVSRHLIQSGGKRVRPYLALAFGMLFDSTSPKRFLQAASIELLHTATLFHDDVVDNSDRRRGQQTAHILWGNQTTILVGDFLFSKAFSLMVQLEDQRVLEILAEAAGKIARGELTQLRRAHDLDISDQDYIEMISGKTSTLFAASTRTAALLAGTSPETARRCGDYGENLGIAFQLADDALDYESNLLKLGKNIGDDFHGGKISAPALYSYRAGDEKIRAFWQRVLAGEQQADDFEKALKIIEKQKIIPLVKQQAQQYADQAVAALEPLPSSPTKPALTDCPHFSVPRRY